MQRDLVDITHRKTPLPRPQRHKQPEIATRVQSRGLPIRPAPDASPQHRATSLNRSATRPIPCHATLRKEASKVPIRSVVSQSSCQPGSSRQPSSSRTSSVSGSSTFHGRDGVSPSQPRLSGPGHRGASHASKSSSTDGSPPPSMSKGGGTEKPIIGFCIGIETEFILEPRNGQVWGETATDFIRSMAAFYNSSVNELYPRMKAQIEEYNPDRRVSETDFRQWVVVEEPTILSFGDNPGKCK